MVGWVDVGDVPPAVSVAVFAVEVVPPDGAMISFLEAVFEFLCRWLRPVPVDDEAFVPPLG
jgi:hypothetical protein